jgi:putative glycosyltransferase (TIGR04348 family)
VRVVRKYATDSGDLLIALHAKKSSASVLAFRRAHPDRPIVVVLTGTDAYRDLPKSRQAQRALSAATAIVTLQPLALHRLRIGQRRKARSIMQSAPFGRPTHKLAGKYADLRLCVIGHLRAEKDPLRAAKAVRMLPETIGVQVTAAGASLSPSFARAARQEMQRNPRYRWLGELTQQGARRLLRSSDLMVLSSLMEGGANVLCEAIACGIPVLASRIPGNVGILGAGYPAYYPSRNTSALARLISRARKDPSYVRRLRLWVSRLRRRVSPARESAEWLALVRTLRAPYKRELGARV